MSKKLTKLSLHDFHAKHGKPVDILPNKSGSSNREHGNQGHSRLAGSECRHDGRHSGLGSFACGRSSGIGSSGQCYSTYPSTFHKDRGFGEAALGPGTDCYSPDSTTYTTGFHGRVPSDFSQPHHAMPHGRFGRDDRMSPAGSYGSPPAPAATVSTGIRGFGHATHAAYSGSPAYAGCASTTAAPRDGWIPPPPPPRRTASYEQHEPAVPRRSTALHPGTATQGMVKQLAAGTREVAGADEAVHAALLVTEQQVPACLPSSKMHVAETDPGLAGRHEVGSAAGQVDARCSIQKAGPQVESLETKWKAEYQRHDQAASTTPFATSVSGSAYTSAAVKNDFAEQLAQKAMANAALAKSSLLSVSSFGSAHSGSGSFEVAVAAVATDVGAADSSSPGVFVKPAHPFHRPRLVLKPRSIAVPDAPRPATSSSDDSSDVADHASSGSAASSTGAGGRPRLNLLPRTGSSAAAGADMCRKSSVFGAAKPREEVLKDRGINLVEVDQHIDGPRLSGQPGTDAGATRLTNVGQPASNPHGSVYNSGDDDWHTVTTGRKGKASAGDGRRLLADRDVVDPFFGSSAGSFGTGPAADVGGRAFAQDIMRNGKSHRIGEAGIDGSYGRKGPGQYVLSGGSIGERNVCYEEGGDSGFGRRGLPTRQAFVGL